MDMVTEVGAAGMGTGSPGGGREEEVLVIQTAATSEAADGADRSRAVPLHQLSELEHQTFRTRRLASGGMDEILEILTVFLSNEWDLSDGEEVAAFHSGLVDAATRCDRPFGQGTWIIPDEIWKSFQKLYDEVQQVNPEAYEQIVPNPRIKKMFKHMFDEGPDGPFPMTTIMYEMNVTYIYFLNVYLMQRVANDTLFTTEFAQSLCRACMTILLQYKSADMSQYLSGFVEYKRPALKVFVRNMVKGIHQQLLTQRDMEHVNQYLDIWFYFDGDLAPESALSLEVDVIEVQLREVIALDNNRQAEKKAKREEQKEVAAERKAVKQQQAAARKEAKQKAAADRAGSSAGATGSSAAATRDWTKRRHYKCKKCPVVYQRLTRLEFHSLHHGSELKYKCRHCDFASDYLTGVAIHERSHTAPTLVSVADASAAEVKVESADVKPVIRKSLVLAAAAVSDEEWEEMAPKLTTEEVMEQMKQEHFISLPHVCSNCPATFTTLEDLNVHQQRHAGTGRLQCKSCDYRVMNPAALRRHQQVHTKQQ